MKMDIIVHMLAFTSPIRRKSSDISLPRSSAFPHLSTYHFDPERNTIRDLFEIIFPIITSNTFNKERHEAKD